MVILQGITNHDETVCIREKKGDENVMKNRFQEPEMNVVRYECEDILVSSGNDPVELPGEEI